METKSKTLQEWIDELEAMAAGKPTSIDPAQMALDLNQFAANYDQLVEYVQGTSSKAITVLARVRKAIQ